MPSCVFGRIQSDALFKDMKTFLIYDASIDLKKFSSKSWRGHTIVFLFPLTSNIEITSSIKSVLEQAQCRVEILGSAKLINGSADRLKDQYRDFISEFPSKIKIFGKDLKTFFAIDPQASLWWLSLVAEKNVFKSDFFNRLSQFDAIVHSLKENSPDEIFVGCSSAKLRAVLRKHGRKKGLMTTALPVRDISSTGERIKNSQYCYFVRHVFFLMAYFIRNLIRILRLRDYLRACGKVRSGDFSYMFITGYPSFDLNAAEKGIFKNRFFKHLQESMDKNPQKTAWVGLYTYNNEMSYEQMLQHTKEFISRGYNLFILDEFLSFRKQFKCLLRMIFSSLKFVLILPRLSKQHELNGYNFYDLVKNEWYSSFVGVEGLISLLQYEAFQSLFDEVKAQKCIYCLEMQSWEKALIYARDLSGVKTVLLGYQHSTASNMLLSYFNNFSDFIRHDPYPLVRPDKIVCNGHSYHDALISLGWPEDSMVIAEAVRYDHINVNRSKAIGFKKRVVLIVFSISVEESSSLLSIVYHAFKDDKNIEIWIKPHPFVNIQKVLNKAGMKDVRTPFILKKDPIEDLLAQARIVIVGESTVSIESLAFGCEIILVNNPEWINMSSLRDVDCSTVSVVSSVEELKEKIHLIFNLEYNLLEIKDETDKVIDHFFYFNKTSNVPERFLQLLRN